MLDTETKRKIDSVRDILVGKIPDPTAQVDQITTALIYKFMDDMDEEAKATGGNARFFTGEFKKFSWPKVMDKRLSGGERMDLYVQALSRFPQNDKLPPLFREIFKNAFLPYRDAETLSLFLKEINDFSYDHSENLGNAFEYLLSILGSQGEAGQFRTPRHIIDFMVEVVDPNKEESVLDPACGTGGFLISSYKHIIKRNSGNYDPKNAGDSFARTVSSALTAQIQSNGTYKGEKLKPVERRKLQKNIIGYDISPKMVKLSLVNMYLHHFKSPKIHEYDTLTSLDAWDESFDVILANPPFMSPKGGIRPHNKFSVKANRSEVLFVDYIAEHLTLNGRAGIIVPEGIIFKGDKAYKTLRKMLVEDRFLWAVVSLPAKVFEPYSGVKTSILFLDKKRAKAAEEILFVDVQNDGLDLGATRRKIDKNDLPEAFQALRSWSRGKKEKTALAHWVSRKKIIKSGDWNLTGNRYKTDIYIELGNLEKNFKEIFDPLSQDRLKTVKLFQKNLVATKKTIEFKQMKSGLENLGREINRIVNSQEFLGSAKSIQTTVRQLQKSTLAQNLKSIASAQKQISEVLKKQQKWPMAALGDICEVFNGSRPRGGAVSSGILSIGGEHINPDGSFNLSKSRYIPENFFNKLKRGKLKTGDVLIVKDGATTGKTGYFERNAPFKTAAVNEHVFILRSNAQKINPFFLYQIMKSKKGNAEILKRKTGAAQGGINLSIKQIKIPLPSLEEQKKIVEEITGWQKIIDGAKQIIENWKPAIKINPEWPKIDLGNICQIEYGLTDTAKNSGNARFIRITDIDQLGNITETDQKFIDISKQSEKYILQKNDILIARTGATFGKTALFDKRYKAVFASYLIRLRFSGKYKILPKYYLVFSQSEKYWNQACNLVTGGAQQQFNGKAIKKIIIPLPSLKEQKQIIEKIEEERAHVESCKKLIALNQNKIQQKINEIWNQTLS